LLELFLFSFLLELFLCAFLLELFFDFFSSITAPGGGWNALMIVGCLSFFSLLSSLIFLDLLVEASWPYAHSGEEVKKQHLLAIEPQECNLGLLRQSSLLSLLMCVSCGHLLL